MVVSTIFAYFLNNMLIFCVFWPRILDLISSKWYLDSPNFYFIIGLLGIYIEHYLGGRVEFKTAINHIPVDFGSSSLIPPPPPLPSPPQLSPNHMQWPGDEPLPSCEGCGLTH